MKRSIILVAVATGLALSAHANPHDVYGVWLTQTGSAHVLIDDCGDGSPCGTVAWMDPAAMRPGLTPDTATDENNPDPALRDQPLLGLTMLSSFEKKSKDWRSGTIYDPEEGKIYGSRIKRLADGNLQVKGCIGPICQTQVWTPATPD